MLQRKKIRIRTFVLGINHGQLLQAKGMSDLLSETFPDALVKLDLYHNHLFKEIVSQVRKLSFVKCITLLTNWVVSCRYALHFSKRDLTVFGADTIWMYNHPIAPNDDYFFGADVKTGQLVAVCPSNAGSPYPQSNIIHSLLQRFKFVGVRDRHTAEFVEDLIQKHVTVVCDPAFFIKRKSAKKTQSSVGRKQLSIYANSCANIKVQLEILDKSLSLEFPSLVYLGYFPNFYTNITKQFLGIFGVLDEVEKSKILITDTFHGVIMALMTKTPFVLVKSDIVMSRLQGPILDCFDPCRICELHELNLKLKDQRIYDDCDLNDGKLEEYVRVSKDHICRMLVNINESIK
ncbi:hypothetical protein UF64_00280 [Thalassospira sp. HJ]|uniref:polysaccharide pyruvyl transferase family protein n=1 Tax=Thalassospira sp. HJ TaxID=1616823 RepID=UPI0005CE48E8|nr:polysaccharide pyruvyl transferase family protein [Thalassospira sp. HJ]KJE37159.1 hypothetical protein UF64_00280 [Thalassospira sp. HJ]